MFSLFSLLATTATLAQPSTFTETLYTSWGQTFTIDEKVHQEKTELQDLIIFDNAFFGRVMALDGVIQLTEKDEPIYHEMMVHVPILTHGNARSVLVIGGGDGGSLREVLKHSNVERLVLVEIDQSVIDLCKEYLPGLSQGAFEDPRVQVVIKDASEYVKQQGELFDVIICDSTDPIGPGQVLFTEEFYGGCKSRLNEGGIFVNQNGVPFFQKDELEMTAHNRKPHFKNVSFYVAPVPTYAGGFMAFGWASDTDYQVSEEVLSKRFKDLGISTFYYTPQIHRACFALPQFFYEGGLEIGTAITF
jgi:spermidine synthase